MMVRRKMPPGPFPYPFVGNIPHLFSDPVDPYGKLSDKYGDIYSLFFPSGYKVVMLKTATLVRKARLNNQKNLSGRSPGAIYPWNEIFGNDLITSDYSPGYRFRRQVFKTAMHVFGSGIEQATEHAMKEIDSKKGQPFSPRGVLESSILVQLWDWLTSTKLQLGDPLIKDLSEFARVVAKQALLTTIHQCIPFFSYLPTKSSREIRRAKQIQYTVFPEAYRTEKETHTPGIIRHLTDSFISATKRKFVKKLKKILDPWTISLV